MMPSTRSRTLATWLAFACLSLSSSWAWAGYDVSYLWHRQLASVKAYQLKIGRILGPAVARDLKVVQKPGLYGLIYYRNGSSKRATQVARSHSRILRKKGLEPAAPVRSSGWNFVDRPPSGPAVKQTAKVDVKSTNKVTPASAQTPLNKPAKSASPVAPAKTAAPVKVAQRASNQALEEAVDRYVKRLRASGKISRDERTAWSVYDFTTGEKLVDINEDQVFQGASLVKPFFAMAFFHQVQTGKMKFGKASRRHMERMIQSSNNPSTNWIMRQVGGPRAIQRILKRHYGGIFQDTRIVEYIPRGGKTYRNKASVHDYSRFLYALWKEEIPGAREIKRLMALPGKDRLYTGAKSIPRGTKVYNKTGSTARLCGDMGILVVKDRQGNRYPYAIVGVIEKGGRARNYTSWIRSRGNVIRQVSNIVYQEISRQHNLKT